MEVIGGVVTLANLALSLVIGLRLVRLSGGVAGRPELWLAVFFLLGSFLGMGLSMVVYMGWADPGLALSPVLTLPLNAGYLLGVNLGMSAIYVFTWKTFRRDAPWARRLALAGISVLLGGFAAIGAIEGFGVVVIPGPAYWVTWAVRCSAFLWLAIESFAYWRVLRKRLVLGLAEPLVTNRFMLWAIWASATFANGWSDVLARVLYVRAVGNSDAFVAEVARPYIVTTLSFTSTIGLVAAVTLFLTFFPTRSYRRLIERRAARFDAPHAVSP
jgi:hypothetical protein